LFRCPTGAGPDPAIVGEIRAYLNVCCRCRAFIEISREGVTVHFEQLGEADLFAEAWADWAAAGSTEAEIPAERSVSQAERSKRTEGSR
jgi:hypothetical protein